MRARVALTRSAFALLFAGSLFFLATTAMVLATHAPWSSGVHLAIGSEPGSITVKWITREPLRAEPGELRLLRNGSEVGSFEASARTWVEWHRSPIAWAEPVTVHEATLPAADLAMGNMSYAVPGLDPVPVRPLPRDALRVAFLGDTAPDGPLGFVAARILDERPDLLVHAGDIAYADGDAGAWHGWLEELAPLLSRVPLMTTLGNHDVGLLGAHPDHDRLFGGDGTLSYDAGPVRFIHLDTTFAGDEQPIVGEIPGLAKRAIGRQTAWLEGELAHARDGGARWVVVILHKPIHSSGRVHGGAGDLEARWAPLFAAQGVDLVVQGHEHNYERIEPADADAPTYLVTGGGGARLYDRWREPAPAWSIVREATYHHVVATFGPDSARVTAYRLDGSVLDEFTLT